MMTKLLTSTNLYDWGGKDFAVGAKNSFRTLVDAMERRGGIVP